MWPITRHPTSAQERSRHTIEDYQRWEGDWELWDGHAVAISPSPFGGHQAVLVSLAHEISNAIRAVSWDATVLVELDWIVRLDTVVRPDLQFKRQLYPEEGVETYLIIDPSTQQIELLRLDGDQNYQSESTEETIELKFCESCRIEIQRHHLF
ncbi:MAG: Uma2 family endonuclease [Planctomycetota bacterium]